MADVQHNQNPVPEKPEPFDADTAAGIQIVRRESKPGSSSMIWKPSQPGNVLPPPVDDSGDAAGGGGSRLGRQSRIRPALKMPEPGRKTHFPIPPGMEPPSQMSDRRPPGEETRFQAPTPPSAGTETPETDMAGTSTIRLSAPMPSPTLTSVGRRTGGGMNTVAGFTRSKSAAGPATGTNPPPSPPIVPLPPPVAAGAGMPMPSGFQFPVAPQPPPSPSPASSLPPAPGNLPVPPPIPGFAPAAAGTGMPMPLMPGQETSAAATETKSGIASAVPSSGGEHSSVVLGLRRRPDAAQAEKNAEEDPDKDAEKNRSWLTPDRIDHFRLVLLCGMFIAAEIVTKGLPLYRAAGQTPLTNLPLVGFAFLLLGFLGLICVDKGWSRVLTGIYFFFCIVSSGVMTLVLPIFAALVARWGRPDYMDILQFLPAVSQVAAAFSLYLSCILLLFGSAGPVRWSLAGAAMVAAMILPWTAIEKCLPREEMFSFGASSSNLDDLESTDPGRDNPIRLPGHLAGPGHENMTFGGEPLSVTAATNYEINLPQGWRFDQLPPNPGPGLLAVLSSLDGLIRVEVRVLSVQNPEATLGFVANRQIEEVRQLFPGVTSMDIKGMPDRKKIYAVNGTDRLLQLVVNGGRNWFLLSCPTSRDLLQSRQEEVDLVFKSFDAR